jgi:hypothetical protein
LLSALADSLADSVAWVVADTPVDGEPTAALLIDSRLVSHHARGQGAAKRAPLIPPSCAGEVSSLT